MSEKKDNQKDNTNTAQIEGIKLVCDYLKHLTTLSTGSIVLLATFLEKFSSKPGGEVSATIAFIGFAVTILGALVGNGVLVFRAEQGIFDATTGIEQHIEGWSLLIAFIGFFVALISLCIFGIHKVV